jgi:hypothetical protein
MALPHLEIAALTATQTLQRQAMRQSGRSTLTTDLDESQAQSKTVTIKSQKKQQSKRIFIFLLL